MANQVKTVFSVETGAAIRAIDAYERRLRLVTDLESKIGSKVRTQSSGGNQQQSDHVRVFRALEQEAAKAARLREKEFQAAQRDAARYARERERMERELTRQVEREAKAQTAVRQREAKRSADTMIAELGRANRSAGVQGGAGRGGFLAGIGAEIGLPVPQMVAVGAAYTAVAVAVSKVADAYAAVTERAIAASAANRTLAYSAKEAGVSYTELVDANRKFADLTGTSDVQATQTTAMIARLAANGGLTGRENVQRLQQTFADLAAARGLSGQQLGDLMGTILSGQDEGLNRLGISDPGQLQAAYAKKIGKSTSELTQQEKVYAALLAIFEKGNTVFGAAQKRMEGMEGSVARLTKAWENFANTVAESFVSSPKFLAILDGIATGLKAITPSSPTEINRRAQAGKPIEDSLRLSASVPGATDTLLAGLYGAGTGAVVNAASAGLTTAGLTSYTGPGAVLAGTAVGLSTLVSSFFENRAQVALQEEEGKAIRYAEEVKKTQKATEDATAKSAAKTAEDQKKALEQSLRDTEAYFQVRLQSEQNYYGKQEAMLSLHLAQTKQEELSQVKQIGALREQALRTRIETERQLLDEQIKLVQESDPSKAKELTAQRDLQTLRMQGELDRLRIDNLREQQRIENEIAEKRKQDLRDVRALISESFGRDNPFVGIFEGAYQSLLKVRDLTKDLGAQIRGMAVEAVQRQALRQYEDARVSAALQSFNLNSSAQDFRSGINLEALTPGQQQRRRMRELEGQLRAIGAYESKPVLMSATPTQQELDQYKRDLKRWEERRPSIDRQVVDLTQGVNPARLDRETRDIAASAREREATRISDQEREARSLFKSLQGIINPDGIKVVLGSGEQTLVRIVNDAPGSAVVSRPNGGSVNDRYGK